LIKKNSRKRTASAPVHPNPDFTSEKPQKQPIQLLKKESKSAQVRSSGLKNSYLLLKLLHLLTFF
jgi:hypothetical protein